MRFRFNFSVALALASVSLTTGCFDGADDVATSGDSETHGTDDGDPTTGDGDGDPTTGDGDGAPSTGDGDGDGDGDPTDTGEDCSSTQTCVDDAVAGWRGPLAIYSGPIAATPPACQGGTPVKLADLFDGINTNETANTCSCTCGPLQNGTCASAGFFRSGHASCLSVDQGWNLAPNNCQSLGSTFSSRFRANAPNIVGGTCAPQLVQGIVEAEFTTRVLACEVDASAQTCGTNGVCMDAPQAPFGDLICIAAEGDVLCPGGSPYVDRHVYHAGLQDGRSCSSCACGLVAGSKCSGNVQLFSNTCSSLLATLSLDQCSASIGSVSHARFVPSQAQPGSCNASGGGIQGSINETGTWTLCCQ